VAYDKESGRTTASVGGGIKFSDPGPKGKGSGIPKGNADVKSLGRAASGKIESKPSKK
jgi:hypothetical protein